MHWTREQTEKQTTIGSLTYQHTANIDTAVFSGIARSGRCLPEAMRKLYFGVNEKKKLNKRLDCNLTEPWKC